MRITCAIKLLTVLLSIANLASGCSKAETEEVPAKTDSFNQFIVLPSELNENSGLIWYDGYIWTINDSSGKPFIYAVDTASGKITRRIQLTGASNIDWEEIAQDDSCIYICDIGNNDGSRKDLRIYKIKKKQLTDTLVTPEIIQYQYADQTDFTPNELNTPFDCEALISLEDTLYLFTKNWTGNFTRIYKVPAEPGNYVALNCSQLQINGQVTASTYIASAHRLYLLGYRDYIPFICDIDDFIPGQEFSGTISQHIFTDKFGLQTEGIAILDDGKIIVSCEKGYLSPAVYKVILVD
jgi:hypothetical protein